MSSADSAGNISRHRKLGELTGNIRIFALPNENQTYTFMMQYQYDSYNRIQTITYPDGEVVSYRYDRGGMLESVRGDKGGDHRIYVENISYNTHGLKESVFYGNGAHTYYDYDLLMRLSHLYSENSSGEAMQDIDYGYDDADNITDIFNNAATLANGLGGNYRSHYDYDNLYRLEHSEGEWDGGQQLNYSLLMQYSPNGRIERKELYAEVMDHSGTVTVSNYSNSYLYNAGQPNTLGNVTDDFTGWEQNFSWDAAGNMTVHDLFEEGCSRQMCWDEENRLAGFSDCHNAGFYQYDANGERTYKLTGGYAAQNIQGHWWSYHLLNSPTLYASPYMVATPQGYTKHYYAESERIASRIGNGGLEEIDLTVENIEDLLGDVWVGEMQPIWDEVELSQYHINRLYESRNHLTDAMMCAGEDPLVEEDLLISLRSHWREISDESDFEPDCYWYHPDHLGSSSWITYTDGEAVQHLHYLPWGEEFVDQRITDFSARHTFCAKERDTETGLSYFGARYYSSDLSIWLSVDPMSGKYPSFSPYVYCANNPVKLVDPNGEEVDDNFDKWKYNKTTGQLDWISNEGGRSHQIVVETQDTPLGEKVYRTVEFDGTISRLFDFSLVSKTVDGIIGGALDMYGGATTVMAGLIIATGGSVISGGAALPVGSVIFSAGAYQTTTGLMQITNAIAGRGVDMYKQQELVRDICKSSGNSLIGVLSEVKPKPFAETIKNTVKTAGKSIASFSISAAWSAALRYRTKHPKYKGLPTDAKVY